jgi:uncharacterized protein DUF4349
MTRATGCLALCLVLGIAGCETRNMPVQRTPPSNAAYGAEQTAPNAAALTDERLVVQRASQKVEVPELDPALRAARSAATDSGGYVENESRDNEQTARLDLRVAAAQLDTTLTRMAALGSEKSRVVSAEDVTESHSDLEVRLHNQEALRDRLRALVARAESVKDVLTVEEELARVQSEIESMQSRLARMNRQVKFSLLSVTFERTRIYGPLGYFFHAIGWGLERLFVIR